MKRMLVGLLLFMTVGACAAQTPAANATPKGITVKNAWIRVLPGKLPAGGYLTLVNHASKERALVSASSPAYAMIMLHESSTRDGMSRMRKVAQLRIPAHGQVQLAPGGYHLMMMQPRRSVHPGERITVHLRFADGSTLKASFLARPAYALGPPTASSTNQPSAGGHNPEG